MVDYYYTHLNINSATTYKDLAFNSFLLRDILLKRRYVSGESSMMMHKRKKIDRTGGVRYNGFKVFKHAFQQVFALLGTKQGVDQGVKLFQLLSVGVQLGPAGLFLEVKADVAAKNAHQRNILVRKDIRGVAFQV